MKCIFYFLLLLWASLSLANDDLARVHRMEKNVSGSYPLEVLVQGSKVSLIQNLSLKDCKAKIEVQNSHGVLMRDTYNLSKVFVRRNLFKVQGHYAINFGTRSKLYKRTRLLIKSKEEFKSLESKLSKLAAFCKRTKVKRAIDKNELELRPSYFGTIPVFKEDQFPVRENARIAPLNGSQTLFERLETIKNAKESLFIQTLMFRGDLSGRYLAEQLMEKRAEGIDIRMIIDGLIGNLFDIRPSKVEKKNTGILLNNLMVSGIRVFGYACSTGEILRNELRGLDFAKLIRRNHEKMWIQDQDVVIMGGINVTNAYFELYGRSEKSFRDIDVLVEGEIVKDIYDSFLLNYYDKTLRYLSFESDKKCFNPYDPILEKEKYQAFRKKHLKAYKKEEDATQIKLNSIAQENLENVVKGLPLTDLTLEGQSVIEKTITKSVARAKYIFMRPEEGERQILPTYLALIKKAKSEIIIPNAFFVPFESFKKEIKKAALRGVKIKILTNSKKSNDKPIHAVVGRTHYIDFYKGAGKETLKENIEIYEFQGNEPGKEMIRSLFHTKYMVVDRKVSILGSYNITGSSENNAETAILFEGKELAEDLHTIFNNDLKLSLKLSQEKIKEFRRPKGFADSFTVFVLRYLFKGLL